MRFWGQRGRLSLLPVCLVLLFVPISFVGCDSSDASDDQATKPTQGSQKTRQESSDKPLNVSGTWSGNIVAFAGSDGERTTLPEGETSLQDEAGTVSFTFNQGSSGQLTGFGSMAFDEEQTVRLQIDSGGVNEGGMVTFTSTAAETYDNVQVDFRGNASGDRMEGEILLSDGTFFVVLNRESVDEEASGNRDSFEEGITNEADPAEDIPDADVPNVAGAWSGTITDEDGESGFVLQLEQSGTELSGEGEWTIDDETLVLEELTGSVDDTGTVELLYQPGADEMGSIRFSGSLDGDSISGEAVLIATDDNGERREYPGTFFVSRP